MSLLIGALIVLGVVALVWIVFGLPDAVVNADRAERWADR